MTKACCAKCYRTAKLCCECSECFDEECPDQQCNECPCHDEKDD